MFYNSYYDYFPEIWKVKQALYWMCLYHILPKAMDITKKLPEHMTKVERNT